MGLPSPSPIVDAVQRLLVCLESEPSPDGAVRHLRVLWLLCPAVADSPAAAPLSDHLLHDLKTQTLTPVNAWVCVHQLGCLAALAKRNVGVARAALDPAALAVLAGVAPAVAPDGPSDLLDGLVVRLIASCLAHGPGTVTGNPTVPALLCQLAERHGAADGTLVNCIVQCVSATPPPPSLPLTVLSAPVIGPPPNPLHHHLLVSSLLGSLACTPQGHTILTDNAAMVVDRIADAVKWVVTGGWQPPLPAKAHLSLLPTSANVTSANRKSPTSVGSTASPFFGVDDAPPAPPSVPPPTSVLGRSLRVALEQCALASWCTAWKHAGDLPPASAGALMDTVAALLRQSSDLASRAAICTASHLVRGPATRGAVLSHPALPDVATRTLKLCTSEPVGSPTHVAAMGLLCWLLLAVPASRQALWVDGGRAALMRTVHACAEAGTGSRRTADGRVVRTPASLAASQAVLMRYAACSIFACTSDEADVDPATAAVLATLLASVDTRAVAFAVLAVWRLASFADNRLLLVDAGVLPLLTRWFLVCTRAVTGGSGDVDAAGLPAGIVEALLAGRVPACEGAGDHLWAWVEYDTSQPGAAVAVPVAVPSREHDSPQSLLEYVVAALGWMLHSPDAVTSFVALGGMQHTMAVLRSGAPALRPTRLLLLDTVRALCAAHSAVQEMGELKAPLILYDLVVDEGEDAATRTAAFAALSAFRLEHEAHTVRQLEKYRKRGAFERVALGLLGWYQATVEAGGDAVEDLREATAYLAAVSCTAGSKARLGDASAAAAMVSLLQFGDAEVTWNTLLVLLNMSSLPDNQPGVCNHALQALVDCVAAEGTEVRARHLAANTIRNVSKHPANRTLVYKAELEVARSRFAADVMSRAEALGVAATGGPATEESLAAPSLVAVLGGKAGVLESTVVLEDRLDASLNTARYEEGREPPPPRPTGLSATLQPGHVSTLLPNRERFASAPTRLAPILDSPTASERSEEDRPLTARVERLSLLASLPPGVQSAPVTMRASTAPEVHSGLHPPADTASTASAVSAVPSRRSTTALTASRPPSVAESTRRSTTPALPSRPASQAASRRSSQSTRLPSVAGQQSVGSVAPATTAVRGVALSRLRQVEATRGMPWDAPSKTMALAPRKELQASLCRGGAGALAPLDSPGGAPEDATELAMVQVHSPAGMHKSSSAPALSQKSAAIMKSLPSQPIIPVSKHLSAAVEKGLFDTSVQEGIAAAGTAADRLGPPPRPYTVAFQPGTARQRFTFHRGVAPGEDGRRAASQSLSRAAAALQAPVAHAFKHVPGSTMVVGMSRHQLPDGRWVYFHRQDAVFESGALAQVQFPPPTPDGRLASIYQDSLPAPPCPMVPDIGGVDVCRGVGRVLPALPQAPHPDEPSQAWDGSPSVESVLEVGVEEVGVGVEVVEEVKEEGKVKEKGEVEGDAKEEEVVAKEEEVVAEEEEVAVGEEKEDTVSRPEVEHPLLSVPKWVAFSGRFHGKGTAGYSNSTAVARQAFEHDLAKLMKQRRLVSLLPTDRDRQMLNDVLWTHYGTLTDLFTFYAAHNATPPSQAFAMQRAGWDAFLHDFDLLDDIATEASTGMVFVSAAKSLAPTPGSKNSLSFDQALVRFEFILAVLLVTNDKYLKSGKIGSLPPALDKLMGSVINVHQGFRQWEQYAGDGFRASALGQAPLDGLLAKHKAVLFTVFTVFTVDDSKPDLDVAVVGDYCPPKRAMTLDQWLAMLDTAMLFESGMRHDQAVLSFAWARLRQEPMQPLLTFSDFLEALCRLAVLVHSPSPVVPLRVADGDVDRLPAQFDITPVATADLPRCTARLLGSMFETFRARLDGASLGGWGRWLLDAVKGVSFSEEE